MDYTVKRLEDKEISHIYKTCMKRDFPPGELKPLGHIIRSMERGFGFSLGFYEKRDLIGYAVLIFLEEQRCALLDYFAIVNDQRGKGLGHQAFGLLERYFEKNLPEIDGIYIEAERIDKAKNETEKATRTRRIAFYLSCGCNMTKLESKLFGVEYSILYRPIGEAQTLPTLEALDAIYRTMFKKSHYKSFVNLVLTRD